MSMVGVEKSFVPLDRPILVGGPREANKMNEEEMRRLGGRVFKGMRDRVVTDPRLASRAAAFFFLDEASALIHVGQGSITRTRKPMPNAGAHWTFTLLAHTEYGKETVSVDVDAHMNSISVMTACKEWEGHMEVPSETDTFGAYDNGMRIVKASKAKRAFQPA